MKTLPEIQSKAALASLIIALASVVSSTAQMFTILKSFGNLTNFTGNNPGSQLVQGPDGTLYGTTSDGEGSVRGTIFKIQPDGSGFAVWEWFTNSIEVAMPYRPNRLGGPPYDRTHLQQSQRQNELLHQRWYFANNTAVQPSSEPRPRANVEASVNDNVILEVAETNASNLQDSSNLFVPNERVGA